jgi:PAS domain S-box-containing protein
MPEAVAPTPSDALIGLEAHILDRVEAAVMAVDLSGTILFANRYVEDLYGWSAEELVGRSSAEVSGAVISPDLAREILHALRANTSWEGTFDVVRKDGSVITVRAIDSPLYDKSGRLSGVVSVGIDGSRDRAFESTVEQQGKEIAARRRAQQIEQFLNRCAVTLSSSLDHQRNLAALAELAVPFLADACVIDIAEQDQVRRVATAHADPAKRGLVEELARYAPDPRGGHPALRALWDRTPSFSAELTDEFLRATTRDERHYQILKELGFSSFVSVPMIARGRTQGALSLMSCSPDRRFDDRDVAVATELAKYAAVALDNAWLYNDQQRARADAEAVAGRLRQLQALSADLSRAVSVTEVAAVIRGVSLPGLDAPTRGLWLLDEPAAALRLVPTASPRVIDSSFETVALDAPLPAAKAVRTGEPVYLHSIAARDAEFPTLRGAETVGKSFAVLPLRAQQRIVGTLALGFPDERPFDEDERRFLVAVAEQCAQALSRALLYDRERIARDRAEADRRRIHALNRALQTSLLPPSLPDIPGLEVSARYQPALAGLEVGGDFYDVFDNGGDWAVVVGDVCGKGPEAAAVTATARWTIRSVAMDIRQPAQVLRKLNDTMIHQQLDGRFCTLAYTRVVPTSHGLRVSVCRGGHPAPLVLRADGSVEFVGTPGSLIGVFPDVRLWEETAQLDPGDAYIAYTDGVTEARRNREQFGDDRLVETVANCAGLDADAIAAAIEAAVLDFGGPEPSDDVALIVLRVPPN